MGNGKTTLLNAALLIIGDEILIGQVKDTNSGYIADSLVIVGVDMTKIVTVGDEIDAHPAHSGLAGIEGAVSVLVKEYRVADRPESGLEIAKVGIKVDLAGGNRDRRSSGDHWSVNSRSARGRCR